MPSLVRRFTVYFTLNLLEKFQVLIQVKIIINAEYMNSNYDAVSTFKKGGRNTSGACSLLNFMCLSSSLSFSSFTAFKAFL